MSNSTYLQSPPRVATNSKVFDAAELCIKEAATRKHRHSSLIPSYPLFQTCPTTGRTGERVRYQRILKLPVHLCVATKLRLQTPFQFVKKDSYHSLTRAHHLSKDTKETTTTPLVSFPHR
jgi:hypothetical protein